MFCLSRATLVWKGKNFEKLTLKLLCEARVRDVIHVRLRSHHVQHPIRYRNRHICRAARQQALPRPRYEEHLLHLRYRPKHCKKFQITILQFDKYSDGFERHIAQDHNLWQYVFYIVHLQCKDKSDYTGVESYVAGLVSTQSFTCQVRGRGHNLGSLNEGYLPPRDKIRVEWRVRARRRGLPRGQLTCAFNNSKNHLYYILSNSNLFIFITTPSL
jgi:hypothetical protein